MAVDPDDALSALGTAGAGDAPRLLGRPADPPPPLDPVRGADAVAGVHRHWAAVHAEPAPAPPAGPGLRRRADRHVAAVAAAALGPAQHHDRALIGDLIRAVDALAERCDTLADRLEALEALVAETVEVLGADLTRLRADVRAVPPAAPGPT